MKLIASLQRLLLTVVCAVIALKLLPVIARVAGAAASVAKGAFLLGALAVFAGACAYRARRRCRS